MSANITVVPAMPSASVNTAAPVKVLARNRLRHARRKSCQHCSTIMTSPNPLLLLFAERNERIDTCGPVRRHERRDGGDRAEQRENGHIRGWVIGRDAEQQRPERL